MFSAVSDPRRAAAQNLPMKKMNIISGISPEMMFRAPPGARTLDTLIKSQVLYQLS